MKQSKTTLKELTAAYRAVLRHGILCNAIALGLVAAPAMATTATAIIPDGYDGVLNISGKTADYGAYLGSNKTATLQNGSSLSSNETSFGGALMNYGTLTANGTTLTENTAANSGGAVYTAGILGFIDSNVVGNSANWGGSVYNSGQMRAIDTTFRDNYAVQSGGAIATNTDNTSMLTVNGGNFTTNHARHDGGAIANFSGLSVADATFTGNTADYEADEGGNYTVVVTDDATAIGGGAIALGAISSTSIGSITSTTFDSNKSGTNGGAIATRMAKDADNSAAKLDIEATFTGNNAVQSGGAIYNTFYTNNGLGKGDGVTVKGTFTSNTAGVNGGAIYNDGALDKASTPHGGVMTVSDSTFTKNSAASKGGAIYNSGTLLLNNTTFGGDTAELGNSSTSSGGAIEQLAGASLTMDNVGFGHNTGDYGGALMARGTVDITGGYFDNNSSHDGGGAIYVGTLANKGHKLNINGTDFTNNHTDGVGLDGGGAIGSFSDLVVRNARFKGNHVDGEVSHGGGAVFMGAVSTNNISDSDFEQNTSATAGGAIGTRWFSDGDNKDATLDLNDVVFVQNTAATNGGAIDNYLYNDANNDGYAKLTNVDFEYNNAANGGAIYNHIGKSGDILSAGAQQVGKMYLADTSYSNNVASANGGAIYNEGNLTFDKETGFLGNIAGEKGGAIYNDATGVITFLDSVGFGDNKANDQDNSVYNEGVMNINAAAGKTLTMAFGNGGDMGAVAGNAEHKGTINMNGTGTVRFESGKIKNQNINVNSGEFALDSSYVDLNDASTKVDVASGATLNLIDNKINNYSSALNLANGAKVKSDFDLANETKDKFTANGALNLAGFAVLTDSDVTKTFDVATGAVTVEDAGKYAYTTNGKYQATGLTGENAGKVQIAKINTGGLIKAVTESDVGQRVVYALTGNDASFDGQTRRTDISAEEMLIKGNGTTDGDYAVNLGSGETLNVIQNAALTIENAKFEGNGELETAKGAELAVTNSKVDVNVQNAGKAEVTKTTLAAGKTITNAATGKMKIMDSTVNADVENYGILESDPTDYAGNVLNVGIATFEGDTFKSTATLENIGTAYLGQDNLGNNVTFQSGARITGNGVTNLKDGVTAFNSTESSNTIKVAEDAKFTGTLVNNGTLDTRNYSIDNIAGSVAGNGAVYLDAKLGNTNTIDNFAGNTGTIKEINVIGTEYGDDDEVTLAIGSAALDPNVQINGMNYYTKVEKDGTNLKFSDKLINKSTLDSTLAGYATTTALAAKANSADVYTKTATDDLLAAKLDTTTAASTYQTKIDAEHKLDAANVSGLANVATSGDFNNLTVADGAIAQSKVNGLADALGAKQAAITDGAKLSADLVNDSESTNKFVTAAEKTAWNAKTTLADVRTDAAADTEGSLGKYLSDTYATNTALALKANADDVYTKTVADDKFATKTALAGLKEIKAGAEGNGAHVAVSDESNKEAEMSADYTAEGHMRTAGVNVNANNAQAEMTSKYYDDVEAPATHKAYVRTNASDSASSVSLGGDTISMTGATQVNGTLNVTGATTLAAATATSLNVGGNAVLTTADRTSEITDGGTGVITSGAVYTALAGKQTSLTDAQLAAANSGITSDKVSAYDAYADQIAAKTTLAAVRSDAAATSTEGSLGEYLASTYQSKLNNTDNKLAVDMIATSADAGFVTDAEKSTWSGKQDAIEDLATIRSKANSALQASALVNTALTGATTAEALKVGGYDVLTTNSALNGANLTAGSVALTKLATTDLSQFNNTTSGFITKDVNNLTHYTTTTDMNTALELKANSADLGSLAALNEVAEANLASALATKINGKADAATTLAGYGITDAYTKTAADDLFATQTALTEGLAGKQATISDSSTIAANDAGGFQVVDGSIGTAQLTNGAVTLAKMNSEAMKNSENATYSALTKLTTQGYVDEGLAGKADKATTLAGYGITDAYTKTEADELLAAKADLTGDNAFTGNQTIDGTLSTTGNFAVNTNKFTVAADTGNTAIAGTLGVTGATTLAGLTAGATTLDSLALGTSGSVSDITTAANLASRLGTDGADSRLITEGAVVAGITNLFDSKETWIGEQLGYDTHERTANGVLRDAGFTAEDPEEKIGFLQAVTQNKAAIEAEVTRATGVEGTLGNLTTEAKGNLVAAINEVDAHADTNAQNIADEISRAQSVEGTLSNLTTDANTNLVAAINEVDAHADAISGVVGARAVADGTAGTLTGKTIGDDSANEEITVVDALETLNATNVAQNASMNSMAALINGATVDAATGALTGGTALDAGTNGSTLVGATNTISALINNNGADAFVPHAYANNTLLYNPTKSVVGNMNVLADAIAVNEGSIGSLRSYVETNMLDNNTSATLTHKTIDADDNTILDLTVNNFKDGVVQQTVRDTSTADHANLVTERAVSNALVANSTADQTFATNAVNALANGAVATNTAAIEKLNGDATTAGSVAYAVKNDAASATYDTNTTYGAGTIGAAIASLSTTANSALQEGDITTGSANGTIAVNGTDVAVAGLGSAAYASADDFDAAGSAAAVDAKLGAGFDSTNTVAEALAGKQDVIDGTNMLSADYINGLDEKIASLITGSSTSGASTVAEAVEEVVTTATNLETISSDPSAVDNVQNYGSEGGSFTNFADDATVTEAVVALDKNTGKVHGLISQTGTTGPKTFNGTNVAASKNKDTSGNYVGNLAVGTTIEDHLVALDNAIGSLSSLDTTNGVLDNTASVATNLQNLDTAIASVAAYSDAGRALTLNQANAYTDERVEHLDKEVSAGVASAVALSSVAVSGVERGEVSVGAGYGYFNGQSAAAFGAAMGLSNRWSVNAGAGVSNADVSFRAGTNYKFKLF